MDTLTYTEARSLILDGDLISISKAHSLFNRLTQILTGEYVHVGVAVWIDNGLWMVEINGGRNHAVPLSQLKPAGFDVSEPPPGVTAASARFEALEALRGTEEYGFGATIATGLIEFFNIPLVVNWRNGRHCAGLVTMIYDRAGWAKSAGFTHTYVISPTKLTKLMKFKFRVMPD